MVTTRSGAGVPIHVTPQPTEDPGSDHETQTVRAITNTTKLDHRYFPHLFKSIVEYLPRRDLIRLRRTGREVAELAEVLLASHIALLNVAGRVTPGLPREKGRWGFPFNPPRFPKESFWDSEVLTAAVQLLDIPRGSDLTTTSMSKGPHSLRDLPSVQLIRDFSGKFDADNSIVLPETREWVSHLHGPDTGPGRIPDTVSERIILHITDYPGEGWECMAKETNIMGLDLTIILSARPHRQWWMVEHLFADSPCESCSDFHSEVSSCDGECDHCSAWQERNAELLALMALAIASWLIYSHDPQLHSSEDTIVTLVDADGLLSTFEAQDEIFGIKTRQKSFMELVVLAEGLAPNEVETRLRWMSKDEYRRSVGNERYNLHTSLTPYF